MATIRELIAGPSMGSLGDNDEEQAEKQSAAREPKSHQGGTAAGHRHDKDAKPLVGISELAPGLRADEIIGAEVRSSDDRIVGEVRNIVFGTKDRQDYAIVASGGFFTTGKDSFVVPIRFLKVSQERTSFFLPLPEAKVKTLPLMPDQDYKWLADEAWRTIIQKMPCLQSDAASRPNLASILPEGSKTPILGPVRESSGESRSRGCQRTVTPTEGADE